MELQGHELNFVLRKSPMTWRILSQPKIHCKGNSSWITAIFFLSKRFGSQLCFLAKSCKISKILFFQVMFNVHEDFNNSTNNFLESSYTAVNWILHWGKRWLSDRYRLRVYQLSKSTVRISKYFSRNQERDIKIHFLSNVLHGRRFQ